MTRTIISILIPFIAPFILYAIWAWFTNRKKEALADGKPLASWQTWPWAILFSVGSVLATATLVILFFFGEPVQEGRWVPPTVVNGEMVPGHYEPIPRPPTDD